LDPPSLAKVAGSPVFGLLYLYDEDAELEDGSKTFWRFQWWLECEMVS